MFDSDINEDEEFSFLSHVKNLRNLFREKKIRDIPLPESLLKDLKEYATKEPFLRTIE